MKKPSLTLQIQIKESTFEISYPTSGQMIDIAVIKAKLSDNQYYGLQFQNSSESSLAFKLIDAYAFLTIMLPKLVNNLNIKSLYDLDTMSSLELIHVYDDIISPWLNDWIEVINNRISELKGDNNKDSKRNII